MKINFTNIAIQFSHTINKDKIVFHRRTDRKGTLFKQIEDAINKEIKNGNEMTKANTGSTKR